MPSRHFNHLIFGFINFSYQLFENEKHETIIIRRNREGKKFIFPRKFRWKALLLSGGSKPSSATSPAQILIAALSLITITLLDASFKVHTTHTINLTVNTSTFQFTMLFLLTVKRWKPLSRSRLQCETTREIANRKMECVQVIFLT